MAKSDRTAPVPPNADDLENTPPMARIDYPDITALSHETKTLIAGRPLINVLRMWAHSEPLLPLVARWGATQFAALELTPRDRELVILAVAHALEADYVWAQHVAISGACGITARERDALRLGPHWRLSSVPFTAAETALLTFALAVASTGTVPDRLFAQVREHYSERSIVEIVSIVGYYFTIARMSTVLHIAPDETGDTTVLNEGLRLVSETHAAPQRADGRPFGPGSNAMG